MARRFILAGAIVPLLAALLPGAPVAAARPLAAAYTQHATMIVPNGSWTTYHRDDGHTGYDPTAPAVTSVAPTAGWTMPTLDETVYAEPLIYNGVVYVATLNDTVYALNQIDGSVIWSKNLGTPQTSGWSCGNISKAGILGTPVIDAAANRIYAAAEVVIGGVTSYHLFSLDLGNSGNIVLNSTLTGINWTIEQERGALAVRGGYVYIPFGGRWGDCGAYHGYVFAVNTISGTVGAPYVTPGQGAGFWSAGGVVIDDANGDIFEASGNGTSSGCNANPDGTPTYENDAVVRLAPGSLAKLDSFVPQDWHDDWCVNDQDLGSASPVLLNSNLLFQSGKWGAGFLLNPNSLGGMDGQLFPTPKSVTPTYAEANTCLGNHSDATFGSFAYAAPFVYVECEGHGLMALNVNTATPSFAPCNTCAAPDWQAGGTSTFGPPIVAGGAVWVANGTGLSAFNASTGAQIYHSSSFSVNRFVTPAEAGGQVFVPSNNVLRSFTIGGSLTITPSHLDFGGQAPGTTSAAQTATLHNNTGGTVNVSSAAITGSNAAAWVKGTDTCSGAAVLSGGTCTVQVSLSPSGFGGAPATLTFTDGGAGSPQTVALNGMGALDDRGHLYTLDGWGNVHADGTATSLSISTYWPGWNIARSVALFPDGTGGYVLDGWGGLHQFGNANPVAASAYWPGWDIARQVVLAPWATKATPAGWTLDGWGGIHQFGGAPAISGYTWWPGWDIGRGIVILPDSTPSSVAGYTLDGWGGIHPFGGAPAVSNFTYWRGWDIARGITLSPDASRSNVSGWTLDGYGGVHPFGSAPAVAISGYWPGWDIARGVVSWTASGSGAGGWVMDGWGGIHQFGNAPAISPYAYWSGWDIATSLTGSGSNSGSRRRT